MPDLYYRVGQAAKLLGLSTYKVRRLCEAGLIDAELTGTQQWRIPAGEVARLRKEGIPEIPPDPPEPDGDDEEPPPIRTTAPSSSQKPALYGPPSKKLVSSKEKVIRLEHQVKAKELERQIREGNRAEQQDRAEQAQKRQAEQWRQRFLDYPMSRVPTGSNLHTEFHAKVEELLNRIRPEHPSTREMVDEIVNDALRPMRRREEQERAVKETVQAHLRYRAGKELKAEAHLRVSEAVRRLPADAGYADMCAAARAVVAETNREFDHYEKIEHHLRSLGFNHLPSGRTSEECERATDLARQELERLPIGASDFQVKTTINSAIAPVRAEIERRNAEQERQRQIASHRSRISMAVNSVPLPLIVMGATKEEQETAKQEVRAALEQLPPTASYNELQSAERRALAPIEASIRQRKEAERKAEHAGREAERKRHAAQSKASLQLKHIERYLSDEYEFSGGYSELRRERDRLWPLILEALTRELIEDPSMSEADIRARIEELIDDDL